ncbi:MAG: hypothetical protein PHO62_07860 [Sulfurimonas sp.]|uniref:hypothetical protein n=1 Tax=Sulfurimonas sp. TaxID=2022749 RepID=UPI0026021AE5|nr:hypothetical protein [Sulfurimonas sp.]MDD5373322.1 hypothetical protein [Sulfurimonas sp.]
MRDINKSVFVVLSSKGGAGKTTAATQFLIPYLHGVRGEGAVLPKLYEVDVKNNASQGLSESKLFHVELIKDSLKELENVIVKESANFMRDYPIIFDVGVGEFDNAFKAFADVFDEGVTYILPTKTSEADFGNTFDSIRRIKAADSAAEFIVVCSDSKHGADEIEFLKDEFGLVFGTWFNPKTRKPFVPLFKQANIPERFVVVKSSELFDKTTTSYKTTVYEAALEGLAIKGFLQDKNSTEPHAIDKAIADVKNKGVLESDPKKRDELLGESEFLRKTRRHYLNCANYHDNFLAPSFREFSKLLS